MWLAYVLLCRLYFPVNEQVATCPGKWPLIGHAHKLVNKEVVTEPEDVSTIVNKCLDKMFVYKFVEPMLGKTLIAAEVPTWKRNRKFVDLCFKQQLLDDYLQLFNERAERFVETLAEDAGQGDVDLKKKITRSILETSVMTTFGINLDGKNEMNDNYVKALNDCLSIISDRIYKPWLIIDTIFNLSSDRKKLEKALETVFQFSKETVLLRKTEHLQRLQKKEDLNHKGGFQSVLDVILENSMTETESVFNDVELRNTMDNMIIAAFDTTIYQMLYVLICIGSSPEVQDKILEEINSVLGKDKQLKSNNLSQLVYLDAVVKEAIRLYPVGPLIGRHTTVHTKLRNVTIPAESPVIVHIWAINRSKRYWGSDAEEFKPERWLDSKTMPKHQAAFATFGPGRRGCVGKTYALMYIKATVVSLLRKYKITADHKKMKLECKVMLKPLSGHLIKIEKRDK
ncbi:cytochrome P450 4C1-like [Spodoptera litura]|uniref:Cytochrome P450 4C1-like n=1 Tax=Spodoptera litura TaxID=69820 RepID=A0A9J7IW65_SPOLT|nr:cytochrome P450 4C1-like [Spodoptera litura]